MASLKARNAAFKTNTAVMHLLDEAGLEPLFCIVNDKTGEHSAVNGTWSLPNVTKQEAFTMERRHADKAPTPIEAIAPKCGKDETVMPMTFTIRNIHSPDAERFRIENGLDIVKDAIDPKRLETSELTAEQRRAITVGSCVVGFQGMVADDGSGEGKGIAMTFSTENLLTLFEDYEQALSQVDMFAGETKKFVSRS